MKERAPIRNHSLMIIMLFTRKNQLWTLSYTYITFFFSFSFFSSFASSHLTKTPTSKPYMSDLLTSVNESRDPAEAARPILLQGRWNSVSVQSFMAASKSPSVLLTKFEFVSTHFIIHLIEKQCKNSTLHVKTIPEV